MTSTRARLSRSRSRMGSGPKEENSGEKTAVHFSVPSAATYCSRCRPSRDITRSPLPMPSPTRTLAKRLVASRSCSYVVSLTAPPSATIRSATAPPRPSATCRSTASWAMLSPRPPGRPASSRAGGVPTEGTAYGVVRRQVRRGRGYRLPDGPGVDTHSASLAVPPVFAPGGARLTGSKVTNRRVDLPAASGPARTVRHSGPMTLSAPVVRVYVDKGRRDLEAR